MADYEIAKQNNCKQSHEHQFAIIRDHEERKLIRIQFPKMTAPLWKCEICVKITESN